MQRLFKTLIFLLFFAPAFSAQNIDSLQAVSDTATGKHLIRACGDISNYYWKRNPYLSLEYAQKAKRLIKNYPQDTSLYIKTLHWLGDAYWYNNNPANALEYGLKVLHLREKTNDSAGLAKTLNNLGVIYSHKGNYEKSLEILKRSLQIRKKIGDTLSLAANYNNIGQIYYHFDNDSLAMDYFNKSLNIRKKTNNHDALISGYNNIAAVYMRQMKYENAIKYLNKAYHIADSINVKNQIPIIMFNLGDIFYEQQDIDGALAWLNRAYKIAEDLNNFSMLRSISKKLSQIYEDQNQLKKALNYSRIVSDIKDSINERNINSKIEQLQFKFNAKQTELENKTLKQKNELSELKLNKEQIRTNLLIILAILAIIIIALLINRYTLRTKHNKHLRKEVDYRTRSLMREINERKRLEQESKELNSRFATIFFKSPLAIVSLYADGRIQMANETFLTYTNASKEQVKDNPLSSFVYEPGFIRKIEKSLRGDSTSFEGKLTFKQKEKSIYARAFFNHYKLDELNVKGVFVTIEDISKNIEAEERVKTSEQRFTELAEFLPEMLVETDFDGKILYANKQALEKFGVSHTDIKKGLTIFELFEEPDRATIEKRYKKFVLSNEQYTSNEYTVTTKNGEEISIITSVKIVYINGKPSRLRGVLIDISERKQKENQLLKAKDKAEKADQLKSKFLHNLSHEIRTPMNGILGFSELIKHEKMSEEERNSYIDFIINSANQLLSIIDDVVNISRIESGEIKIAENEVSLENFFNNIMIFFHGYLMNRNDKIALRLQNKIESYNDRVILAEKQVQHILSNLIYNAIKFTQKGHIEIGIEKTQQSKLRFYVKDTGMGIAQEEQEKIFDRFYKVHDDNQKSYGGTGLGLTIAKALTELLGGTIGVKSEPGSGSEFYFTIPWVPAKTEKPAAHTEEKKNNYPDWSNKHLLVVEDDTNNYLFLEQLLKKTNANIYHVVNGKEAVDYVKAGKPSDVVLMDIQMPVMDGYEATRAIRTFNKDIPILAQTANAMVEDKSKSLDAGCDDYVAKPVNKTVLLNKIGALMK